MKISWNVNRFLREYEFWLRRYQTSLFILDNNIPLLSHLKHTIIYEELQMDLTKSLKQLFFIILQDDNNFTESYTGHNSIIIKRGQEDLKQILSNFDQIEKHLRRHQCICHLKMLTASVPIVMPKVCIRNESYSTCPF